MPSIEWIINKAWIYHPMQIMVESKHHTRAGKSIERSQIQTKYKQKSQIQTKGQCFVHFMLCKWDCAPQGPQTDTQYDRAASARGAVVCMCQLPRVVIAKYHKLCSVRQQDLFCCSSGRQESETTVSAKLIPSAGPEGEATSRASLSSGGCWQSFMLFDLFVHHSTVCLSVHTAFFPLCARVCVFTWPSYKDTTDWI